MANKPRYRINYDDIPVISVKPEDPGNEASFVVRRVDRYVSCLPKKTFVDRYPEKGSNRFQNSSSRVTGWAWLFMSHVHTEMAAIPILFVTQLCYNR